MPYSCQTHATFLSLSCQFHVNFMPLSCHFHVDFAHGPPSSFMTLLWQIHSTLMALSPKYSKIAEMHQIIFMSYPCQIHVRLMSLSCRPRTCNFMTLSWQIHGTFALKTPKLSKSPISYSCNFHVPFMVLSWQPKNNQKHGSKYFHAIFMADSWHFPLNTASKLS